MHNLPALGDLRLFCIVLRRGGLAAAAAEVGASPSFVSKRMSLLEAALGTKLLHRTTRRVAATDDGLTVLRWAQRILGDVDDMAQELSIAGGSPRGTLRVSTSPGFGRRQVAAALSAFARLHPAVTVQLELHDQPVDLIAAGLDIEIRLGGEPEPHLYARRLADNRRVLCASPSYLARHGRPADPADLAEHRCLVNREPKQAFGLWRLDGPAGVVTVRPRDALTANDGAVIHRWALDGHGIMLRSLWDVGEALADGRLQQVLPDYGQKADIWALYPTRLARSPKVQLFLDLLIERLDGMRCQAGAASGA